MKYENIKEFVITTKRSKSKIYRFYKVNEDLFAETTMKSGKRVFPIDHARYFDSEIMYDENKNLRQENGSMRNLINCLMDRNSLPTRLWNLEWSFFYAVAYKVDRNKKSCFKQMHGLFEHLNTKFGDYTALRIFFTTEQFTNRTGFHNHFVLHIANRKLHDEVLNEIKFYFSFDRVDLTPYDPFKAGLFYASKEGLMNEDWDIIGNNLKRDGMLFENKSI